MQDFERVVKAPEWARELMADMAFWEITQKEIADRLGVTPTLVGMILSGRYKPTGANNGIVKEDIIKAENQIREVKKRAYERRLAKNGGE